MWQQFHNKKKHYLPYGVIKMSEFMSDINENLKKPMK